MQTQRRLEPREVRRVRVRFGTEDTHFMGYTRDMTPHGLRLDSRKLFRPGTRLRLTLDDGRHVRQARVVWAKQLPVQLIHAGYFHSMGLLYEGG